LREEEHEVIVVDDNDVNGVVAGTVTNYSVLGVPTPEGEEEAGDEGWRLYPTVPITAFFDACIDKMSGASVRKNKNYVRV
jgi:hypothetical protein